MRRGARGPRACRASLPEPTGVVLVDHGSRRAAANSTLHRFARTFRRVSGRELVEVAHMELAEPNIAQAVTKCVERGAKSVVVSPYFLSPGRHIQEDIPALVEAAADQHPGVPVVIAKEIGVDPQVAQVIEERIRAVTAPP